MGNLQPLARFKTRGSGFNGRWWGFAFL